MKREPHPQDIEQLNSFLRGELAAIETYDQVLGKVESPVVRTELNENRASHARRVQLLAAMVRQLGGEPDRYSGAWGALARAVQGGAKLFGLSTAIAVLEEGEDHGLRDYTHDLERLTPDTRDFVTRRIVPEQRATHDHLASLKEEI